MSTSANKQEKTDLDVAVAAMIEGAAQSLTQLFGAPVDLKPGAAGEGPNVDAGAVVLSARFSGAVEGDSRLVIPAATAQMIAAVLNPEMPESGPDGESTERVLTDAMAQFTAGAAAALAGACGAAATIAPPTPNADLLPDGVIVVCEGAINGATGARFLWQLQDKVVSAIACCTTPPSAPPVAFPSSRASAAGLGTGVIDGVELDVAVELGNVALTIGELLHMGEGSVVTLTQEVGDHVVMLANGTPVANGEVVIVDGTLGFRVAELITEPGRT